MKNFKNYLRKNLPRYSAPIVLLTFFFILFFPFRNGIGNFWDWNLPYFASDVKNYFLKYSASWTDFDTGMPLKYASDYYLRFSIYLLSFIRLKPETLYFLFLTLLFSSGSYGVYLIARKQTASWLALLLSICALVNPAIFYKLVAGHTGYLVGFVVFIYLTYYLVERYTKSYKSALAVGLLTAFSAVQIQFFLLSIALLLLFYIFKLKESFRFRDAFLIILVAVLINLPWLSNFLLRANDLTGFSATAAANSFNDASSASFLYIFFMVFSKATLIRYYYPAILFAFFSLFYLIILYYFQSRNGRESKFAPFYLFAFVGLIFLNTGLFAKFDIAPFNTFFPMFREVGHFSPLVLLFGILLLGTLVRTGLKMNKLLVPYLLIFLSINLFIIIKYVPATDYRSARAHFQEFANFKSKDPGTYRILTYPFFSQYSFTDQESKIIDGFLANNSGYDNFTLFSEYEPINQYIANFDDSIQYQFLQAYNVEILKQHGVRYIFDYSAFYESNYERYVASGVYHDNLDLVKADKEFFAKIIAANPGKIEVVSPNILKIKEASPRISSEGIKFQKLNPAEYKVAIRNLGSKQPINFSSAYNSFWHLYLSKDPTGLCDKPIYAEQTINECLPDTSFFNGDELSFLKKAPIFEDTHKKLGDYSNSWQVDPDYIKANYDKSYYKLNPDGSIDVEFRLIFWPQAFFYICLAISALTLLVSVSILSIKRNRKA